MIWKTNFIDSGLENLSTGKENVSPKKKGKTLNSEAEKEKSKIVSSEFEKKLKNCNFRN